MKKLYLSLLLALSICTISAQPRKAGGAPRADGEGGFQKFQCEQIASYLKLEGEKLTQFQQLYVEYIEKTRSRNMPKKEGARNEFERINSLSEQELDLSTRESFKKAKESSDVKEQFYNRFREFLSAREVALMYEIERRTRERFISEMQHRRGERQ